MSSDSSGDDSAAFLTEPFSDDMPGRVQDDEALLVFATVRTLRPSVVLLFGHSYGRNAHNILKAMADGGVLYTFDSPSDGIQNALGGGIPRVMFLSGAPERISASDLDGKRVDFAFLDGGYDLVTMQKIFVRLLPLLSDGASLAVHDTGTWQKRHFSPLHGQVQKSCPQAWLNEDEFQHHKDARLFVNWVAENYPAFQAIHFHSGSRIRHGVTFLQQTRTLPVSDRGEMGRAAPTAPPVGRAVSSAIDEVLPGVGDAVCINLRRRPERWRAFDAGARRVGIGCIRRFEAIDGDDLPLPAGLSSHRGTYGCLHSHAAAYEEALAKGVTHLFVAEDDCVFLGTLSSIKSYLAATLGKFSWIHFGGTGRCYPEGVVRGDGFSSVTKVLNAHAYIIDRELMELYVQWVKQTPFPVNEFLHSDRLLPHLCKAHNLKISIPPKPLAWQDKSMQSDVPWGMPKR